MEVFPSESHKNHWSVRSGDHPFDSGPLLLLNGYQGVDHGLEIYVYRRVSPEVLGPRSR